MKPVSEKVAVIREALFDLAKEQGLLLSELVVTEYLGHLRIDAQFDLDKADIARAPKL